MAGWFAKHFSEPALPAPPVVTPVVPEAPAPRSPVFNPSDKEQVGFAAYRADAIARDIEQRVEEGRPQHPQHDMIVGEAMAYAWMLVGAGLWTRDHVAALAKRVGA